jgi:hypothetical protein
MRKLFVVLSLLLFSSLACAGLYTPTYGGMPYMRAVLSGTQPLTSATEVTVAFNTPVYDSGGYLNTSTFQYTPKVAGKYLVTVQCTVQIANATSLPYQPLVSIAKNGTDISTGGTNATGIIQAYVATVTDIVTVNGSTDFISARVSATGTTLQVQSPSTSTFWTVTYLGP